MKFYGQFEPPVDKFLYERYFKCRSTPGIAMECGAFDGTKDSSCKFFEESLGWRTINIEASPIIYEQLVKNRPTSLNLNVGLAANQNIITFTHAIHPELGESFGNGSFAHTQDHRAELDTIGCRYQTFQVETIPWSRLIEQTGITRLDLFVLDVEGYEAEVLESMVNHHLLPGILCVEHGQLGFESIYAKVQKLGYIFDCISHVNSFYIHSDVLADHAHININPKSIANFVEQNLLATITEMEAASKKANERMESRFAKIYASHSWRLTAPLRYLRTLKRRMVSLF